MVSSSVAALVTIFCLSLIITGEAQIWRSSPHHRRHQDIEQRSQFKYNNIVEEETKADDFYRLPTALKPTSYYIRLRPFIGGNFSIEGYTEIDFDAEEITNVIQFHMLDIITKNETIQLFDLSDLGTPLEFISHEYNVSQQVYIGTLKAPLVVGNSYVISMEFQSFLSDGLAGFYRSVYQDENGEDVYLATTQMEPIDARKAFPCFDEPAMKATFTIELGRDSSLVAVSNMPLFSSTEDPSEPGLFWDVFDTSLPMSSYLVAFIISDFVQVSRTTNDGQVLFGVWTRPEALAYADLAIQHGPDMLSFFEGYYNIPFPLEKQDMFAIPDFSAGAMENWGLITYREVALLYDANESDAAQREYVDLVMAHELAHQWFGDLVTMEWWTDLWLNEGFAEYMQYLAMNDVSPQYDVFNTYTIHEVQYAFSVDDTEDSHPLRAEINSPADINNVFDSITYQKGSSVIRMMKYFLTEATFRQALTNYLNDNAYANALQDDLWAAMTVQSHADGTLDSSITVNEIMNTWTLQMGYPIINVAFNADGTADLTQERYLDVFNANSTDTNDYKWWVPITWTAQDNPTFDQEGVYEWMTPAEASKNIAGLPSNTNWIVFNVDQSAYYRVNYDQNNWQLLTSQLQSDHTVMSILTRSQLIDDAMNFAKAVPPRLSYPVALGVNAYLGAETDYVPWVSALDNLQYLEYMFTGTAGYRNLKAYLLDLLTPFYNSVGFADSLSDPHLTQLSRSMAVSWTCHLDYPDCVDQADALYAQWMNDSSTNPISPNVRPSVYCTGIATGADAEWEWAYERYLETDLASEISNLINSMGCSRLSYILVTYLDLTFMTADSPIRTQDVNYVWSSVARNDFGNDVAWNYLNNNWEAMHDYYGSYYPLAYLASVVTREWNTQEELLELQAFRTLREDNLGPAIGTIVAAIENVQGNIDWMVNNYDTILQWLVDQGYSTV